MFSFFAKLLAAIVICTVLSSPSAAQDEIYVELNYMKSLTPDYSQIESTIWKPIHQERIRRGTMLDWALYSVRYGDTDDYDYVTVNVYDSIEDAEGLAAFEDVVSAVHPQSDIQEISSQTLGSRRLVRSELWTPVDQVRNEENQGPAPYLEVGYMDVSSAANEEYLSVERDLWKPLHEATLGTGGKTGWALYTLVVPYGTDYPYNYATVSTYTSLNFDLSYPEASETAHPDMQWETIVERTLESRDLVKGQIWSRVDATE